MAKSGRVSAQSMEKSKSIDVIVVTETNKIKIENSPESSLITRARCKYRVRLDDFDQASNALERLTETNKIEIKSSTCVRSTAESEENIIKRSNYETSTADR